jgi:molybdate transport system substrate-binding protein
VEQGNARYGIVYKTDASISKKVSVVYEIPPEFHDPIVYMSAVMGDAEKKNFVPEFFLFLRSAEAKAIYKKYGFLIDE